MTSSGWTGCWTSLPTGRSLFAAVVYLAKAIEAAPQDRSRYAWIARLLGGLDRHSEAET